MASKRETQSLSSVIIVCIVAAAYVYVALFENNRTLQKETAALHTVTVQLVSVCALDIRGSLRIKLMLCVR